MCIYIIACVHTLAWNSSRLEMCIRGLNLDVPCKTDLIYSEGEVTESVISLKLIEILQNKFGLFLLIHLATGAKFQPFPRCLGESHWLSSAGMT